MAEYLGVAKNAGVTDEEVGAVQAIVMAVQAGRVRAQFREARGAAQEPSPGDDSGRLGDGDDPR